MLRVALVALLVAAPLAAQEITGRRLQIDAPGQIQRLRFVDGNRLLVFAGDIIEYDWRAGTVAKRCAVPQPANPDCTDLSPDGSTIAVSDGSTIRLIDAVTGIVVHEVTNASSRIFPCVFSP